jgi:hypothetical protein
LTRAPPGRQRVAERPRRVQEDAQRHQVKGDRRERLEVLGAGEFFAVDAVDGQAAEADAQLVVEQRLRVGEVSQPGVGAGHVRELDREAVADVVRGQARARVVGEADAKLAAGPAEELVRIDEDIDAKKVVFAKAPPPAAGRVDERVGDEEDKRPNALGGQLRACAQPVAKQVFLAEFLARFGDGGGVRFTEQVIRVLAGALAGGALRRLDLCRRVRF